MGRDGRYTALHQAASAGRASTVHLLLEQGPDDGGSTCSTGETPLHRAAAQGHTAVLQLLLPSASAAVNARINAGWTPLFLAARAGSVEALVALLDGGADPLVPVGPAAHRRLCWEALCLSEGVSTEQHGAAAEALLHCTLRCVAQQLRAAGGASAWASALHLHEGRPWRGWTEGSLLGALTPLHLVALCGDAASIRQAVATPGAAALLTQRTGGVLGGANRLTALELVIDLYGGLPVRWRLH